MKNVEYEIQNFIAQLISFGSGDIRAAIEAAVEAGKDGYWAAEQVEDYVKNTDMQLKDIDPVYVVFDALLQEARNDIEDLIGKDILNDTNSQVEVYANFMCTSLDYTEKAQKELKAIMLKVPRKDFTEAMVWLWDNAELEDVTVEEEPEEEEKTEEVKEETKE